MSGRSSVERVTADAAGLPKDLAQMESEEEADVVQVDIQSN